MKKLKGCYLCIYLDYYEKECYESSIPEGYFCDKRDDDPQDKFKKFPCKRKLKCLVERSNEGKK